MKTTRNIYAACTIVIYIQTSGDLLLVDDDVLRVGTAAETPPIGVVITGIGTSGTSCGLDVDSISYCLRICGVSVVNSCLKLIATSARI